MAEKTGIIRELGENGLLLPDMVNNGLNANDRIKYYFTLLQTAQSNADRPGTGSPNLSRERENAGIISDLFDRVVPGSKKTGPSLYQIPGLPDIFHDVRDSFHEMLAPIEKYELPEATDLRERMTQTSHGDPG